MLRKTYTPRPGDIKRNWRVIDAAGKPLGRVASEIANALRGKDKVIYSPHADTGDFVVVINAAKVRVTGAKTTDKMYYRHSMYPGGLRKFSFEQMLVRSPRKLVELTVWGMMPKNKLSRHLMRKLKVYAEATHPHGAQISEFSAPVKAGRPGTKPPRKVRQVTPATAAKPAAGKPVPAAVAAAPVTTEPSASSEPVKKAPSRPRSRRAQDKAEQGGEAKEA
ncbi:MAG: 50S ribosomal protein L13 [Chloroflexi bacterium]|nr:50S ribosomal protein L13 [Chloroflexota bacterium]